MAETEPKSLFERVIGSGPTELEIQSAIFDEDAGVAIPNVELLHERITSSNWEHIPFTLFGFDEDKLPTIVEMTTESDQMFLLAILELKHGMEYEDLYEVFLRTKVHRENVVARNNGSRGPNFIEIYSTQSAKKGLGVKTVIEHDPKINRDQVVVFLHPESSHPSKVEHPQIGSSPEKLKSQLSIFGSALRTTHAVLTHQDIYFNEVALIADLKPPHLSS